MYLLCNGISRMTTRFYSPACLERICRDGCACSEATAIQRSCRASVIIRTVAATIWMASCKGSGKERWPQMQQELRRTDQKRLSQKEVACFLLGLGIGLVVGLLFQLRPTGPARSALTDARSALPSPARDARALEMSLFS